MTSHMYYAPCFVHVEHSVCHKPISVLVNIYICIQCTAEKVFKEKTRNTPCLKNELRHWPSIAGMLPQNHCGDEEDGRIGLSS